MLTSHVQMPCWDILSLLSQCLMADDGGCSNFMGPWKNLGMDRPQKTDFDLMVWYPNNPFLSGDFLGGST